MAERNINRSRAITDLARTKFLENASDYDGMNTAQIARLLGVSKNSILNWARGASLTFEDGVLIAGNAKPGSPLAEKEGESETSSVIKTILSSGSIGGTRLG